MPAAATAEFFVEVENSEALEEKLCEKGLDYFQTLNLKCKIVKKCRKCLSLLKRFSKNFPTQSVIYVLQFTQHLHTSLLLELH